MGLIPRAPEAGSGSALLHLGSLVAADLLLAAAYHCYGGTVLRGLLWSRSFGLLLDGEA